MAINFKEWDSVRHTSNGYTPVCKNGKWGAVDTLGMVVIPPQYSSVSWVTIREQAIAMAGNKFGVVGRGGQWVIPPEWDYISFLYDRKNGQESDPYFKVAHLADGSVQLPASYADRLLLLYKYAFHEGVMDYQGRTLIPAEWDGLGDLSEGTVVVRLGYKIEHTIAENRTLLLKRWHYGLVGLDGGLLAEPTYDCILPLRRGLAWMRIGERWGLLNDHGEVVRNPWVTGLQELSFSGYYKANRYGGWGVLRYDGALIIDFQWDNVRHVKDDIFEGRRNKQWHRIVTGGQVLEKPWGKRIR